jgi:hypothetical protein
MTVKAFKIERIITEIFNPCIQEGSNPLLPADLNISPYTDLNISW